MQRYLLVPALFVAACGGAQNPPTPKSDGVLTITDDRGDRSLRIKPDGTIVTDNGAIAMLTAGGELREGDLVMARIDRDGALTLPDWPKFHVTIRPDGSVVQDGKVVAEFGDNGLAKGELIAASGMRLIASGDRAARRNLMTVWVGMMGSLLSLGSDEGRSGGGGGGGGGGGNTKVYEPRGIYVEVVATKDKPCGTGDGVTGKLREHDGTPMAGATIVVNSPDAGMGSQAAISDEIGCYLITGIPAGRVEVTVYYLDSTGTTTATMPAKGALRVDATMVGAPTDTGDVILIEPGNRF